MEKIRVRCNIEKRDRRKIGLEKGKAGSLRRHFMVYNSLNVSAKDSLMGELSKLSIPSSLPQTLTYGVSQDGFISHFLQVRNRTG